LKVELDWLKKKLAISVERKRELVEPEHPQLSLRRQCTWLGLARGNLYDQPVTEGLENLELMRRMTAWLRRRGYAVHHQRGRRRLRTMGLEAIDAKPRRSQPAAGQTIDPYRWRGVTVDQVNQVWSAAITSVRLAVGCVYLVAVIDWCSR